MPIIIVKALNHVKRQSDYLIYHNSDMSEFKDRLKEARKEAKLTQAQLAKLAGLKNQSIIGSLESGHRKSTTYIVQLAKILKVEPIWLDTGEGPKHSNEEKRISKELAEFLGIPDSLCTLELAEQLQTFAKETNDNRNKALDHIQVLKTTRSKTKGKGSKGKQHQEPL